jgi:hypothetical protein
MPADWTFADLDPAAMDINGPRPARTVASYRCPKTSTHGSDLDYDEQASSLLSPSLLGRHDEAGVNLVL